MNSSRATKDLRHESGAALKLSQRAVRVQPQPMFRILAEAMQIESLGHPVIHLEIGDTSSLTSPELTRRLREDKHVTASLGYSPSAGEPVLRDVLARHYSRDLGVSIRRENVVITLANAAITQLIGILCDEGDAVLLPDPAFSTYQLAARYNSVNEVFFPLREAAGFAPNIAETARAWMPIRAFVRLYSTTLRIPWASPTHRRSSMRSRRNAKAAVLP